MVRAVLFDLFETLITESGTQPRGVSSLAEELGCERQAFRREWKAMRPAVTTGAMSFRQALRGITERLGGRADEVTLQRLCERRARSKAEPFALIDPQVLSMVDALRGRGLRLGVVSNCCAEDVAAWASCPLALRFDCAVFSFAVGVAKPDPQIFREAARRLEVEPFEAWYIADGAGGELAGAEQAGLRAFKALWFLTRWPHYRGETGSATCIATTEDVLALIEKAGA